MNRKLKDIPRMEFIGKTIEVVAADNPSLIGIMGKVMDETKNTLVIETKGKEIKKLLKKQITIKTTINEKKYIIDGSLLQGRPEDRLKKNIRIKK